MAIDIGDAVLNFTLDQSQGMAQIEQLGGQIPAKMAPAQAAINATSDAVSGMTRELAVGQQGAVELGEVMNLAGEKGRESMYEARGEMMLLDEMIGIKLPRHVVAFLAELPGVGVALSAAFQATAILFIIEAVVKLVEKIVELKNSAKEIDDAWAAVDRSQQKTFQSLEDNLLRAQITLAELTGNHLEALRLKLQLIDNTTLGKLDSEFQKLGKEVDAAFDKMDRNWFSKLVLGLEGSEEAKSKFDEVGKAVDKALNTRTPEAFAAAMTLVQKATDDANAQLAKLNAQQQAFEKGMAAGASGGSLLEKTPREVDPRTIQSYEELRKQLQAYTKDIQEAQAAEEAEKKAANDQERQKQLDQQAQAAKRNLETQLAGIEQEKASQHAAFAEGTIDAGQWSLAQSKAANDAAKAQDDYKDKLAALAKQGVDGSKAMAAAQDAATEKLKQQNKLVDEASTALAKAQSETAKLRAETEKLVFPVEKTKDQSKAFDELTRAEGQLAQAQKLVAEASIAQDFATQEEAIKKLASFRIISKEQEGERLRVLYAQEENDAIAALSKLLSGEITALNQASAKFEAASKDALFPPAELANLKTKLDQAQAAYDKTEAEILKTQQKFDKESLASQQGTLAQSVTLFLAAGKQKEAAQLLEVHSALLSAQAQLADAKARGTNTQAMQDQVRQLQALVNALKTEEKTLETTAKQGLSAWTQFSQGFRDEAQQNIKTMQQMGLQMEQDVSKMGSVISDAFSAMLSGQESFGAAMLHSTEKMIAQMAQQWAEYFLAKGIADVFFDPPLGAAELAAGAALEAISGVLGGLGSAGAKSSAATGAGGTAGPAAGSAGATAGGKPVQNVNVVHLASGGLVTQQTLAIVGDAPAGGRQREAVIPLDNPEATSAIAKALGVGRGGSTPMVYVNVEGMISADNLHQVIKKISREVSTGRARLTASNSIRVTKRS